MNKITTDQSPILDKTNDFFTRVVRHDALAKGTSAFLASALFAVVSEVFFPTKGS